MNKDGLWAQLEKGANKVTVTDGNIRKAFEELAEAKPKAQKRDFVLRTGEQGAKLFNKAVKDERDADMHRFEMKELIIRLDEWFVKTKMSEERYCTITNLIVSEDIENFNMAKKIIESYE